MRRVRAGRFTLTAVLSLLALLIGACGGLGTSGTTPGGTVSGAPEKTHITVGTLPIADSAALFVAIHRGFFKEQGLTVTPEIIQASPLSTPKLLAGTMDFSLLNYVSTFEIEANVGVKFRIVADAVQSAPGYFVIMVPKGSKITSPTQLKGETIAVATPNATGTLSALESLKPYGITPNEVKFTVVPYPNMLAALATGQADAATVTEPFITVDESVAGAHVLVDMMTGPMSNFPVVGWGTTQQYVQKYPRTVAAFQRAIVKAQQVLATDRKAVEQIVLTYTKITPQVASIMSYGTYNTTLSAIRLQRVADLMQQYGYLHAKLDVAPIVLAPPNS